jgi:hypothetical protein
VLTPFISGERSRGTQCFVAKGEKGDPTAAGCVQLLAGGRRDRGLGSSVRAHEAWPGALPEEFDRARGCG